MLNLGVPWWEFIVRALVVYLFLFVGLRLTGRRQVGQLAPFDFVLLLILSNAVQNSMNGGDNSLVGGLILAATLFTINHFMGLLAFRNAKMAHLIDGRPTLLIHNGEIVKKVQKAEMITHDELLSILRRNGLERVEDVRSAIIEPNGSISVIARK